jgi:hypothetical protein
MSAVASKFIKHAENLKKRIEHPGGFNNGADTAYVSFLHEGEEYTVTVTSNFKTLSASLWKGGRCLETVIGKDGVLFAQET